jgi:hypothetical protein
VFYHFILSGRNFRETARTNQKMDRSVFERAKILFRRIDTEKRDFSDVSTSATENWPAELTTFDHEWSTYPESWLRYCQKIDKLRVHLTRGQDAAFGHE